MKKLSILILALVTMTLSGCYSHRVIGYLQEPTKCNKLPVYDSVPYEPYKLRVNDEIIYRYLDADGNTRSTLRDFFEDLAGQLQTEGKRGDA